MNREDFKRQASAYIDSIEVKSSFKPIAYKAKYARYEINQFYCWLDSNKRFDDQKSIDEIPANAVLTNSGENL